MSLWHSGSRTPYWAMGAPEVLTALSARREGLSGNEASLRLAAIGPNSVATDDGSSPLRLALRQIESPLVLILVFGAVVSLALRQWTDAIIIIVIVTASAALGFAQEHRASAAVARLRERLALRARVMRDGAAITIAARDLVPGDIVLLAAGNLIPADGIVLEAKDFLVSQSALTGESFPVEKSPGKSATGAPVSDRRNCLFLGTSVRSGTASMVVTATGRATLFGEIAGRLAATSQESAFGRGLRDFGLLLSRIMVVMVLFALTVNMLLERPAIESLLFAVALAVGLSPELLPAIVSVTLSAGARRMADGGVIVRRLDAIEDLGGIDVLCTDKTGTLTVGAIELDAALSPDGANSERVRRLAHINACLESGIENPLDQAIVADAEAHGALPLDVVKIDEIPYDFRRKRLTIVVAEAGASHAHLLVTKGAFDTVVACCTMVRTADGEVVLDASMRDRLQALYETRGDDGFRVLGVATRQMPRQGAYGREDEREMTFEGFLLFLAPLKEGIEGTIRELSRLGIGVKIITGDNRFVARNVARTIGLDAQRLMTGAELNETRDEALWHLAETTDLFVEVDPQQKERIVRALQARGHAVAYLGDGINDAPALHAADVGISVDTAVDVARESADVVLMQRDLDVLKVGILDGRRTFANTLKYIAITTSANFGNMISMALATLFVPFLPLTAKQILLNNFLSDIPSIAIATDSVDPETTSRAQRWNVAEVRSFMIVFGMLSTVFDLFTFAVLLSLFGAGETLFQTTWFLVSLLTELAVVLALRTRRPILQSRPSTLLAYATLAVAVLTLLLPYIPPFAAAFGFAALPLKLVTAAVAIAVCYVAATEITKQLFFSRGEHADPPRTAPPRPSDRRHGV